VQPSTQRYELEIDGEVEIYVERLLKGSPKEYEAGMQILLLIQELADVRGPMNPVERIVGTQSLRVFSWAEYPTWKLVYTTEIGELNGQHVVTIIILHVFSGNQPRDRQKALDHAAQLVEPSK